MAVSRDHSLDIAFDKGLQMAFPAVVIQLLQALLEPEPSFADIAGFLKKDTMLAAKVLQTVNTVHYGFLHKVTNIEQAAIAMGTSELFKLLIALSLQKRLNPASERNPEHVYGDWRLTLWSASAAEAIAGRFCPDKRQQAYLAAMLKDVQLFLAFCREEVPPFLQNCDLVTLPGEDLFTEEAHYWGSTHPALSQAIFLYWGFPEEMAEAVEVHHDVRNAARHSPLARSVIFATRWAELLVAPMASPGKLAAFELVLAKELGLDLKEMERFREELIEKFDLQLTRLGINCADPETRLYDKPLSTIQSYYLLAHRSVSALASVSRQAGADILRDQLRLFWDITSWELGLLSSPPRRALLARCTDGELTAEHTDAEPEPGSQRGWNTLVIRGSQKTYGYLSVCAASRDCWSTPLSLFVHILGMCFDEVNGPDSDDAFPRNARDIPFLVARLDERDKVLDATNSFFEAFGLNEASDGLSIQALLRDKFGIDGSSLKNVTGSAGESGGGMAFIPPGRFPATPLYINRHTDKTRKGGSYLLLGDVAAMSEAQSLALMFPSFMESLFSCIRERVCLLDKSGSVIFHSPSAAPLAGVNIFNVSRPLRLGQEYWHEGLLARINTPLVIQASLTGKDPAEPLEMVFAPLPGGPFHCCLLTLRALASGSPPAAV